NVFLDQRRRIELLLYVVNAFHQFLHAVHHRVLVDADGAVFRRRLHNQREADVLRVIETAAKTSSEVGRLNAMELEKLFRQRLVLGEIKRLRAGSSVGTPKQVEVSGDVHLFGIVAGVRFSEIEKQVGDR